MSYQEFVESAEGKSLLLDLTERLECNFTEVHAGRPQAASGLVQAASSRVRWSSRSWPPVRRRTITRPVPSRSADRGR